LLRERLWNPRKHGGTKRRVWRKVHSGIDKKTLKVRAVALTSNDVVGTPMRPELLDQILQDQDIASVTTDGAYDAHKYHDAIAHRGTAGSCHPARTPSVEDRHGVCSRAQRGSAGVELSRVGILTAMGWRPHHVNQHAILTPYRHPNLTPSVS
jgi:Transposase DDE domain